MKKAVRIIIIAATAVGATFGTIAIIRKEKANKAAMLYTNSRVRDFRTRLVTYHYCFTHRYHYRHFWL